MESALPGRQLGTVVQVVRYPVKSMRGESLPCAELCAAGLAGDRQYALESDAAPPGMLRVSGSERRMLLRYAAVTGEHGVQILSPGGQTLPVEAPDLLAHFPGFSPLRLTVADAPQTDCRPLSVIGMQTISQLGQELGRTLDPRHFRANLYADFALPFEEDTLVGSTLRVGPDARIRILERDPRCRFFTLDPETAEPLPALMTLLHRSHQSRAGVYASVVAPGRVAPGDAIRMESAR